MNNRDFNQISTDVRLISGTGDVSVEKNSEGFRIKYNNEIYEETTYSTLEEAISNADNLIYKLLSKKLEKSIRSENVILLTGAGSSKECGGPSMSDLWKSTSTDVNIKDSWDQLINSANYNVAEGEENLEDLLSNLQTITRAHSINGENGSNFSAEIKKIETKIVEECRKVKISSTSSHIRFLSRILRGRSSSSPRLKVFTLNYDTAFEQAGREIEAVVIDGFLFSYNTGFRSFEFNLDIVQREHSRIYNEENFYKKVFHLYKLHGSVDWKSKDGEIVKDPDSKIPVLVYPNSSKFEKSFEMPFFEMVSRLQDVLRRENTTLFIVGYGFGDNHVNRIVQESIRNNLNLEVYIVKPTIKGGILNEYVENVRGGSKNIHLIGNTFEQFSIGLPDVKMGELLAQGYDVHINEKESI